MKTDRKPVYSTVTEEKCSQNAKWVIKWVVYKIRTNKKMYKIQSTVNYAVNNKHYKAKTAAIAAVFLAEIEGFEPSRRSPALHP